MKPETLEHAVGVFRKHGGILRTKQAISLGIHPRTLYALRDLRVVERIGRGLYRLAELPAMSRPDLVSVALQIPRGVVCLVSALSFHDLTTQIPHEVQIALVRGTKSPASKHPPIRVFRFSGKAFSAGIEVHVVDNVEIRVYSPAKTIADCFRFRNQIGLDVAIEALQASIRDKRHKPAELLRYARISRVQNVMMPYLEALQ